MKNIKSINELFDDGEQMYHNPLETGKNIIKDFKKQEYNPIWKYLKTIFWEIPILQNCAYDPDDNHFLVNENDVLTFILRNDDWHLSCAFYFPEWNKSDFCILYQKSDYRGDIMVPLDMLNIEDEYCYVKDYDMKTSKEAIDILKNTFVPLMKRFGLEGYDVNKDIKSTRLN
jgi:hypothetical protein